MSRPDNTANEIIPIPAIHGRHLPGAIEAQEARGAAAMAAADCKVVPVQGYDDEELTALGFVLGGIDPNDSLFREARLPAEWTRTGTEHSLHTAILDEAGRKRITIFYKAAWYDRQADLRILSVYSYVDRCLSEGTTPVLDDTWATREAVLEAAAQCRDYLQSRLQLFAAGTHEGDLEMAAEVREQLTACDALTASLSGQPEATGNGDS